VDEPEVSLYVTQTFPGVDVVTDSGNSFFFYNPNPDVPPDHRFPFVTLVANDLYDQFSNLDRPGIFRLNIGVSRETFRSLFALAKLPSGTPGDETESEHAGDYDFTALDQVMPHPVYGPQHWVSVLNPSEDTFHAKVQPLLTEAYQMATGKYERKATRR